LEKTGEHCPAAPKPIENLQSSIFNQKFTKRAEKHFRTFLFKPEWKFYGSGTGENGSSLESEQRRVVFSRWISTRTITRSNLPGWDFFPRGRVVVSVRTQEGRVMNKTLDEQLSDLEDDIRKLKIEFDIYFNGGKPRPPYDTKNRVETLIKRLYEDRSMRFQTRFRYNQIVSRFTAFRQMWQRTIQDREEGRDLRAQYLSNFREAEEQRREEFSEAFDDFDMDAALDGMRNNPLPNRFEPTTVRISRPEDQEDCIRQLFDSVVAAKRTVGENADTTYEKFREIIIYNTRKLCAERQAEGINFSVDIENGKVKFKAK
jgi:hypothetical protein